jgi:signal transduction histidine kinase
MNWTLAFFVSIFVSTCIIISLATKLYRVKGQLSIINDAIEDIKTGNRNRRILTKKSDMTKEICYSINEIAMNDQAQLIRLKQSEQAYKRLMTSLSHDVKTPLTSLVGYLEAIQEKIVTEEEKEEYICVALDKAHRLKEFVELLFEWVKMDAKEQTFQFEIGDLNELTRDTLVDWIPVLEDKHFEYEINIPDTEYNINLDKNAYKRILNNLLQNILLHSQGDKVSVRICENAQQANIIVSDNGIGINENDLPHIFDRLYKCDESRSHGGSGLGLAIVKELTEAHHGTISVESKPESGTVFTIILPSKKAL